MTQHAHSALPPVIKSVVVPCPPKDAFHYFTADMAQWWPLQTHSCIAGRSKGSEIPLTCVFEPRSGGRIFERGTSGEEHPWGTVLAWEPPAKVSFTWHPGRPTATAQHVDVTFTADRGGTRVLLTHTGWETLGEAAADTRSRYDSGWELVLVEKFVEYAVRQAPSAGLD
jgi:uncharacterized protein YndB with AHSA1/START domain